MQNCFYFHMTYNFKEENVKGATKFIRNSESQGLRVQN